MTESGGTDHRPGVEHGQRVPVYMAPRCGCQTLRIYREAASVPLLAVADERTQLHFDVSALDADDALWWVQCLLGGVQVWDEFLRRHYTETARRPRTDLEVRDGRHAREEAREAGAAATEAFFRSWDDRFSGPFTSGGDPQDAPEDAGGSAGPDGGDA